MTKKTYKHGNQPVLPIEGLAEESTKLELIGTKNNVDYFSIKSKTILNHCSSNDMPFEWTINPYRGCEFGCKYCYARYTHEYLGMEDARDFETKIYVKLNAPEIFSKELIKAKVEGKPISIGTATDPYQPAERRFQLTRKLLQILSNYQGLILSVTTKSALITRDADLLKSIAGQNKLHINFSLITLNSRLARILEPRAATPQKRLDAIKVLSEAGLYVGVFLAPILPKITDSRETLEAVIKGAVGSGARYIASDTVNLRSAARKQFFPFLAERFPHLLPHYQTMFKDSAYVSDDYDAKIRSLVKELWEKYRPAADPPEHRDESQEKAEPQQINLFLT